MKVTLNGSLIIERWYFVYYISQNADETFHVESVYRDTYTHGDDKVYETEKSIESFNKVLEYIRKTEKRY